MTAAVWVVGGWVGACALLLAGWACGHRLGYAKAAAHVRQWEDEAQRYEALCDDWENQFEALQVELARADATIGMLRRNDDLAFLAGQQLRREREEWGLT